MRKIIIQFFILVILIFFSSIIYNQVLDTEELQANALLRQFDSNEVYKFLSIRKKWEWIGMAFLPIIILVKIFLASFFLYTGIYFTDKNLEFKKIFYSVIKAQYIFLFPILLKIIWFYFFTVEYQLEDTIYFFPLSAINIVGYKNIDPWFIYPLQVLNLFELAYWFILAYLLGKELNISMDKGFKIVTTSYVPALAIWVVAVMFFTLSYS